MPEHPSVPPSTDRSARRRPLDLHSPLDWLRLIGRNTRRLAVLVLGVAILGAGIAMLALPGPGVLVLVVGLAVLATEFAWAERALDRTTSTAAAAASKVSASRSGRTALIASGLGMVVGGAVVVALVGDFRVVGVSVAIAGLIGLATLHPRAQRWLDSRTSTGPVVAPVADVAPGTTGTTSSAAVPAHASTPVPPHHTNGDHP
ncbi:MAG: hypothetical protein NTZ21_00595 [Actinobacteria bacterium]|nr:hypothetical protein [Actinomycetota bacterium]